MSIFNKKLVLNLWETQLGQYYNPEAFELSEFDVNKYNSTYGNFIEKIAGIGILQFPDMEIPVYHLRVNNITTKARVKISQMAYQLIKKDSGIGRALFFIEYESENGKYRLSYVRADYDGKTDPKRYTFRLGEGIPSHTAETRLTQDAFSSIDKVEEAFSVEPINKEFYSVIQKHFNTIVDNIKATIPVDTPEEKSTIAKAFTLRFLGRMLFCWFLREKSLIPEELLRIYHFQQNYYKSILEPLFFDVLNKEYGQREVLQEYEERIPFLNGGLFMAQDRDYKGNIELDDTLIKNLIQTFEQYNFTVDESTSTEIEMSIDPEMLGRIFENLLAEIDENTGVSARKSTGSFYTPREIVDYMVVESLKQYFRNTLNTSEDTLTQIFSQTQKLTINDNEKISLLHKIHILKILDPACGSGAYPMGILQRIFFLIGRLDPEHKFYKEILLSSITDDFAKKKFEELVQEESFDYAYKMKILKDCIYGVDIQESAIEISRLRAFLSLIVEEKIDDEKPNRGIEPLPNLQFQFITANSLIGLEIELDDLSKDQLNSFISQIQEISKKTFSETCPQQKEQLKQEFEGLMEKLQKSTWVYDNDKEKLSSYHPFNKTSCEFFEPHIQFGIDKDTNFDIVIGNPPYVQIQKLNNTLKKLYANQHYSSYTRVGDLYQLFYERSFNLLAETGVVAMITSNKWMRAGYGITTRSYFEKSCHVYKLLDLGGSRFESATVDTCIIFYGFNLNKNDGSIPQKSIPALNYKTELTELEHLKTTDISEIVPLNNNNSWIIMSEAEAKILHKMTEIGTPLKDWDISINRGVLTGFNEAFIIDTETKDRLIKEDSHSAEIIKPLLRGRDIKRYSYEFADKWLISTFPALKLNIDNYPAVKKYLQQFRPRIDQIGEKGTRKKTSNKWFETQDTIAYYEDFEKPKIIYPETTQQANFYYDNKKMYIDKTCFIITGKSILYIIAVLSSKLGYYLFYNFISTIQLGDKGYQYRKDGLINLPIPHPTPEQEKEIVALVQTILSKKAQQHDTSHEENNIDKLVYEMYGLTDEEIKIVEGE